MVAINLYCKLPFGRLHSTTPEIVAVAKRMGRTPASLSMKLCNLASLDTAHQARGVKGLQNASRADREIWQEFHENWSVMGRKSEELYQRLMAGHDPLADEARTFRRKAKKKSRFVMPTTTPSGATESIANTKVRRGQDFFRKAVLASYDCRCCITGIPIPQLLTASHIKPWGKFPRERLNPRNGLCLSKTHDAAFDAGLISFDSDRRLLVSTEVEGYLPDDAVERWFVAFKGKPMRLPEKFQPEPAFLRFHLQRVFRG